MREKIKQTYKRRFRTFQELLVACCSLEEDFVYKLSDSRDSYFRFGVGFEQLLLPPKKRRVTYDYLATTGPDDGNILPAL